MLHHHLLPQLLRHVQAAGEEAEERGAAVLLQRAPCPAGKAGVLQWGDDVEQSSLAAVARIVRSRIEAEAFSLLRHM